MTESLRGHYKRVIKRDSPFLGAWDLHDVNGKPFSAIVKIERIEECEVVDSKTNKTKLVPAIVFEGKAKRLHFKSVIGASIEAMHGPIMQDWIGKTIEIYPTTTNSFGVKNVPCVRVKTKIPTGALSTDPLDQPVDEEMRAKQEGAAGRSDRPSLQDKLAAKAKEAKEKAEPTPPEGSTT